MVFFVFKVHLSHPPIRVKVKWRPSMVDMIFTFKKNRYTSHVHFCIQAWCRMFIARQETKQRGQQDVTRVFISLTYHKLVRNGVRGLFPLKNERTSECLFLPLLVPCPVSIFFKWHWRNSHINRSTASGNLKAVRVHLCWFMSRLIEKLLYVEDHHFVVFFGNAVKKWYIMLNVIIWYRNLLIFKDIKRQHCPSK